MNYFCGKTTIHRCEIYLKEQVKKEFSLLVNVSLLVSLSDEELSESEIESGRVGF